MSIPTGGAPIRSLNFQRRDSEVESPEDEAEKWSGVRSHLDAILGVLSGGRWSSEGGGRSSERHKQDQSTGRRSSEKGRKLSISRSPERKGEEEGASKCLKVL